MSYDAKEISVDVDYEEVQKMLRVLANNFSSKTKLLAVPPGTKSWPIKIAQEFAITDPITEYADIKTLIIPLISFFGMYVGYCEELDLLLMWKT